MTPESIELVGCNQIIAVHRDRIPLAALDAKPSIELGYYAASIPHGKSTDSGVLQMIRDHWPAIDNGVHFPRDWTYREDDCQAKDRGGQGGTGGDGNAGGVQESGDRAI